MQKVSDSEARAAINDSAVMSRLDMSDFAEYGNGGVLPPPKSTTTSCPRRQKSKHACESCKLRKRKCDGNQPCYMCERYEYDCHYAAQPRRKRSRPDERVEPERNGSLEIERLQPKSPPSVSAIAEPPAESLPFLEANSTLRFAQVVRNRLNPNERPSGLHDYAWNLGLRLEPEDHGRSIASIINKQEMRQLADSSSRRCIPSTASSNVTRSRSKSRKLGVTEPSSPKMPCSVESPH